MRNNSATYAEETQSGKQGIKHVLLPGTTATAQCVQESARQIDSLGSFPTGKRKKSESKSENERLCCVFCVLHVVCVFLEEIIDNHTVQIVAE